LSSIDFSIHMENPPLESEIKEVSFSMFNSCLNRLITVFLVCLWLITEDYVTLNQKQY